LQDFKETAKYEKKLQNTTEQEYQPKYDFSLKSKDEGKPKENNLNKFKFGNK
jgi:hypothetical protein